MTRGCYNKSKRNWEFYTRQPPQHDIPTQTISPCYKEEHGDDLKLCLVISIRGSHKHSNSNKDKKIIFFCQKRSFTFASGLWIFLQKKPNIPIIYFSLSLLLFTLYINICQREKERERKRKEAINASRFVWVLFAFGLATKITPSS